MILPMLLQRLCTTCVRLCILGISHLLCPLSSVHDVCVCMRLFSHNRFGRRAYLSWEHIFFGVEACIGVAKSGNIH